MSFNKVLIANRGEIAIRIIEACHELGLGTVAVYSQPDREQLHVELADESYCIGPKEPAESYLNLPALIGAADISGADAIHPGYGFLAENAHFAEVCEGHGIHFIGPPSSILELAGDKIQAKKMAEEAGVNVLPGSLEPIQDQGVLQEEAKRLGPPLIIKAAMGGGGRGMRVVEDLEQLEDAFRASKREARISFDDESVYLEKLLEKPKHIEVQLMADEEGNCTHLGERECSTQRRHQKLIEEAPAPNLSSPSRQEIREAAIKVARAIGYKSLGTVEFLVDEKENYYFIELNARIQVEHPVSEEILGINMIKDQLQLAQGDRLRAEKYKDFRGHAIECRINAEDPSRGFTPSAGKIKLKQLPGGNGVRFDSWIKDGAQVLPYYDSLLGKLIVHGEDRPEAIMKAVSSLRRFQLEGVRTTKDLLIDLLRDPDFRSGQYTIDFIEEFMRKGEFSRV